MKNEKEKGGSLALFGNDREKVLKHDARDCVTVYQNFGQLSPQVTRG
ncbi:MAG: hypothetical protein CM15mV103_220 [uncultured marine virus]|nr:MAG: hypothetical protein CM15mV103_220 [uncultured marine virus]